MKYTRKQLIDYIVKFYEENGRVPVCNDFVGNPKYPSPWTYAKVFGSWNIAIGLAGLSNKRVIIKHKKYTKDQLLEYIRMFYTESGRVPIWNDFVNNQRYPGYTMYVKIFGGLENAIRESGLWEKRYNPTHACDRCGRSFKEYIEKLGKHPLKEYDEKGSWTGRWNCQDCYEKYDPNSSRNIMKAMRDRRIHNLDPDSNQAKGDRGEELLCRWKGYINLNKKNDNYNSRIDCFDDKTGEYYQAKVAYYNSTNRSWRQDFRGLQDSIIDGFRFESLFLFCASKDGSVIERIYNIPEQEIIKRSSIGIYGYIGNGNGHWYDACIVDKEDDLRTINEIWNKIINDY